MKLKRLIAITVALATILSCSCVAGINVSAAEVVDTLFAWNGVVSGTSITNSVGTTTTFAQSSAGTGTGSTSSVAYSDGMAKAEGDEDGYYYAVSYYMTKRTTGSSYSLESNGTNSIADNVLSFKAEVYIPEATKTARREMYRKMAANQLGTTSHGLSLVYEYDANAGVGKVSGSSAVDTIFDNYWSSNAEMETNKWYTWELRYTYDATAGLLTAGAYLDDTQVAYAEISNTSDNWLLTTTTLSFKAHWDILTGEKVTTDVDNDMTYYDQIAVRLLDKTAAPSSEEPAAPVTDQFVYSILDMDNATITDDIKVVIAKSSGTKSTATMVTGSVGKVGGTYALEDDYDGYGSKVLKLTTDTFEAQENQYHRDQTNTRVFLAEHNGLEQEIVIETAADINATTGDRWEIITNYAKGGAAANVIALDLKAIVENGKVSGDNTFIDEECCAVVPGAEISRPYTFTTDEWHKVRFLNYYTYDATDKNYDVKVQVLCDNAIVYENRFVVTQPAGYEEKFGIASFIHDTFASESGTVDRYLGDITMKSFANGTYDDSAYEWYIAPDTVDYDVVRDGSKLTVNANIYDNASVTSGCLVIALFDANGKVVKLAPSTAVFSAANGRLRTLSAELTDDSVATASSVKVFLFDALTSAKPLIVNYSAPLN